MVLLALSYIILLSLISLSHFLLLNVFTYFMQNGIKFPKLSHNNKMCEEPKTNDELD